MLDETRPSCIVIESSAVGPNSIISRQGATILTADQVLRPRASYTEQKQAEASTEKSRSHARTGISTSTGSSKASTERSQHEHLDEAPPCARQSSACWLYPTSGSTGHPHYVVCEHGSAVNYVLHNPLFTHGSGSNSNSSSCKRVLLLSSFTFDPSAGDAFGALVRGDIVCIAPRDALLSSPSRVLRRMCITHVHATPAVWACVDFGLALPDLRVVALGGERSPPSLTDPWVSLGVCVLNVYGATEGTVYQTACKIQHSCAGGGDEGQGVDIGKAIENVHAHVLDPETLEPASEGVCLHDLLGVLGPLCIVCPRREECNRSELN